MQHLKIKAFLLALSLQTNSRNWLPFPSPLCLSCFPLQHGRVRTGNFLSQVLLYERLGKQPPFPHQMQTFPCLRLLLGLKELPSLTAARSFMPWPQPSASKQSDRTAPASARGEDRERLYTTHQRAPASQLATAAAPAASTAPS